MIPVIQLSGALDFTNYMFFLRCMRVCRNKSNLAGLCLQISSQGGSGVRADVMAKMCRDFCDQRGIKLYTFVDKYACSAAMLPLASSDRVYVHPESIVGGCLATASRFVSTDGYGVELWNAKSSE